MGRSWKIPGSICTSGSHRPEIITYVPSFDNNSTWTEHLEAETRCGGGNGQIFGKTRRITLRKK